MVLFSQIPKIGFLIEGFFVSNATVADLKVAASPLLTSLSFTLSLFPTYVLLSNHELVIGSPGSSLSSDPPDHKKHQRVIRVRACEIER